ncbi:MAG: transglycosylase SLT domain-containing protein, partial [Bacteroidaceae bacterium]|nr:transglycosylase SLT domain-containing protein [Bacteroidaceae bacterium]
RRRARPPMLDRACGIISPYDDLFLRHSRTLGWDWRLLAALSYQESAFDPRALSWAGAQGLMQLIPATAAQRGKAAADVFDPPANIAAGCRYLKRIAALFSDITDPSERIAFTLAAYNGGYNHVRDAMALAEKYGASPRRWRDVSPYILRLSEPQYYRDPVVRYGYLRGTETEAYVRLILQRWHDYRGVARPPAGSQPTPASRKGPDGKFRSRVKSAEEWTP